MAGLVFNSNKLKGLVYNGQPITAVFNGQVVWPTKIVYDYYRLEVGWEHYSTNDNLTFQGMSGNGSMLTSPQVPSGRHKTYQDGLWTDMTTGEISNARGAGSDAASFYSHQCQFDISGVNDLSAVKWKTGQYYAPNGAITACVYGIKNGNATVLASMPSANQAANTTYTVTL